MAKVTNYALSKLSITPDGSTEIVFCLKSIQPPGYKAGDDLETTDGCGDGRRTKVGSAFYEITDCTAVVAYDPVDYAKVKPYLGQKGRGAIKITLPDSTELGWQGWLKQYTPSEGAVNDDSNPTASISFGADDDEISVT